MIFTRQNNRRRQGKTRRFPKTLGARGDRGIDPRDPGVPGGRQLRLRGRCRTKPVASARSGRCACTGVGRHARTANRHGNAKVSWPAGEIPARGPLRRRERVRRSRAARCLSHRRQTTPKDPLRLQVAVLGGRKPLVPASHSADSFSELSKSAWSRARYEPRTAHTVPYLLAS